MLPPATLLARTWKTEQARALWGGVAAHRLASRPTVDERSGRDADGGSSCTRLGGRKGGTQRIVDALVADIVAHGGKIETSSRVSSVNDLPSHDVLMLDVVPAIALEILGDRLPSRIARAYRSFSHGPGAFKGSTLRLRAAFRGRLRNARRAGTVHVGGSFDEIAVNERLVVDGKMPAAPFVLVGQQYLADPSRSAGNVHPIWAYAHVPHGYTGDATEAIVEQIERFAPASETVSLAWRFARRQRCRSTTRTTSAATSWRGRFAITDRLSTTCELEPVRNRNPGRVLVFVIDATWAGAHGMCGANAADRALTRRISR